MMKKGQGKPIHVNTQVNDDKTGVMTGQAEPRRQSLDTGISPTYYDAQGESAISLARKTSLGSPVYEDANRIYFSHQSTCSCKGSGVGCECSRTCSC